jgi:hypothetical protein
MDDNYNETIPRCAKFIPGQGHKDPAACREHLDNMQMSDFIFTPYESRRHVKPLIDVCWFSGWLRCGDKKGMHLPQRVCLGNMVMCKPFLEILLPQLLLA